ncbi:MAG TPA: chitobiase/beta-hexosaminidase C-terminal domain-containing protein [Spirochaetia bacterium]|nr:chitobiase/beta-hexosaminidase C-terminal domain-containing protein [Spirochaetia bacterium]
MHDLDRAIDLPVFGPILGTYTGTQTVTHTASTPNVTIRYTTNGVDATQSYGKISLRAFAVIQDTTVKAVAYDSKMESSESFRRGALQ